jgi:phospholipid-hydroperoxide glutathione peroxidase
MTDANYKGLQALHDEFAESRGLRILGFPCNQFGSQEPGTNEEIKIFATEKYGVKFDMFAKLNVNGDEADPLWKYLKHKQGGTLGDFIKWNFTKFIIDKNGQPVKRYSPKTAPADLKGDLGKFF